MFKATKKHVLQLSIFVFAFVYRIILMFWQKYPSSADIGVHASVINSILQPGNTDLMWNFYQMGGGVTLAFPGYHIFASTIMIMTGLPNYVVQGIISSLFSALIVLTAFLITRIVWSESAACVVAFFVAISRLDIEILSWGGYPNITALFLIPLVFYLFLKRDKITTTSFLVVASVLSASIFLTHSLSAAVFVGITAVTSVTVLVFPKLFDENRKNSLYWLLSLFIGAIIVSPFLANAVPHYLNESATFTGTTAIEHFLLEKRMVPINWVLAYFACIVPFSLLSKKVKGRFFSLPVFLLIIWILVPLLLTQSYLIGFYVDYVRFPYFLIIPVLIVLAVLADYVSKYFAKVLGTYYSLNQITKKTPQFFNKLKPRFLSRINCKTIYTVFLASVLLILLFCFPIFSVPWKGAEIQSFYQFMNDDGYEGIEWVKQNTPVDSMFVSDANYGWWLAGFGQRPTISAVELQCLTLAREVDISRNASYLLDTNYVIDNGYIQVREDGGYVSRHNPQFLVNLNWSSTPFSFFQFNSSQITLISHDGSNPGSITVDELPVTDMQLSDVNSYRPSIIVNKANNNFSYSETITITEGTIFATVTIKIQSNESNMSLDWLNLVVNSQGIIQQQFDNTIAMIHPDTRVCGQLIFVQNQPKINNLSPKDPCITQLSYNLQGKSEAEIQILVGLYTVSESIIQNPMNQSELREVLTTNMQNPPTVPDLPITTFDYKVALQEYNVSYIANRDFELNSKYADDPQFSQVFINNDIAIFKVEDNATSIN